MNRSRYEIVDLMLKDMENAPEEYRPTSFWQEGAGQILVELETAKIENFRRMKTALDFFIPEYGFPGFNENPSEYEPVFNSLKTAISDSPKLQLSMAQFLNGQLAAKNDYRVYISAHTDGPLYIGSASESVIGNPHEQFEFDGRRFSRSFLNYLLGLSFLKKHCDCSAISTVLEIGGGYGTLGEILIQEPKNQCTYINVDIPPTAFFSTYYLQQVLGNQHVCDYISSRKLGKIDIRRLTTDYKAAVLCPWQLPHLTGKVDLFVNFISFQEMEPEIVKNYLSHVSRLGSTYVLLRNMLEGKQLKTSSNPIGVETPILGDAYDDFLPDYDLIATCCEPFGYLTVDGFHSQLRLYKRKK